MGWERILKNMIFQKIRWQNDIIFWKSRNQSLFRCFKHILSKKKFCRFFFWIFENLKFCLKFNAKSAPNSSKSTKKWWFCFKNRISDFLGMFPRTFFPRGWPLFFICVFCCLCMWQSSAPIFFKFWRKMSGFRFFQKLFLVEILVQSHSKATGNVFLFCFRSVFMSNETSPLPNPNLKISARFARGCSRWISFSVF